MTSPDSSGAVEEDLRKEMRKLIGRASRLKLDLHDLAEDLPSNWDQIMDTAQRTYDAYARLDELERQIGAKAK